MRNLFDQFEGRENRLTHALVCALERDTKLRASFLKKFATKFVHDSRTIKIGEQTLPGEAVPRTPEERNGLPDAVLWDAHDRLLAIEVKITARLNTDQLCRHYKTLEQRGFRKPHGLVITLEPQNLPIEGWSHVTWIEIYRWLDRYGSHSLWASELARYIEIVETQMDQEDITRGYRMVDFSGIHFSKKRPYTYQVGKQTLRGLLDDVCEDQRALKRLDLPKSPGRREAITNQSMVWDFLAAKREGASHTGHIHYTAGIGPEYANAYITIPNGAGHVWKTLRGIGIDEFRKGIETFLQKLGRLNRTPGVVPQIILVQRRFRSQRSMGIVDGRLIVDPRTSFRKLCERSSPRIKYQPQWLDLIFELIGKKRSNLQLQFGCQFDYDVCSKLTHPDAKTLFIDTWFGGKTILDEFGISVKPPVRSPKVLTKKH